MEKETIKSKYYEIASACKPILNDLLDQLKDILSRFEHIDRIYGRIKGLDSFIQKINGDQSKYNPPFSQVEDFIALRVVVIFPKIADEVTDFIKHNFCSNVEDYYKKPKKPNQFGYEGHQIIQSLDRSKLLSGLGQDYPRVIEIQVKTLFMHAWSEAEHLLQYEKVRNGKTIPLDYERRLAWIAASSWGSDQILSELFQNQ